ncbi:MAG: hypothetical protein R3Y61_02580 [Rikenellaceae bacterium]
MMKKIFLICATFFALQSVQAQTISELYKFSNYDFSAMTARSAAMAGAYTSLGADLSSMSINPAGIAMYSSSEVGFSFGLNSANTTSSYGSNASNTQNSTQFSMPNIAGVYNVGDVTIGFGVSTLANFNSSMRATGNYEQFNSKARIWADQLNGISASKLNNDYTLFSGQAPVTWDAIMAYDSYLIDPESPSDNNTSYGLWGIIDPDDYIASQITKITEGSLNELTVSAGYNFDDFIYLGATLGFQFLYYSEETMYEEFNKMDASGNTASGVFDNFYVADRLSLEGVGFNMKVGATVRPLSWLRVGLAYHSPTWMNITEYSVGEMQPYFTQGSGRYSWTPDLLQDYNMQSPSRLLAGVSATLFGAMIVSFDYERVWYNVMMYTTDIYSSKWRDGALSTDIENLPTYFDYTSESGIMDLNAMISDYYRPINSYKVGLEVQPIKSFFIRGGFAYSDSPYADEKSYYSNGDMLSDYGATTKYSAGIGYRTGKFNIDFAYVNTQYTELPSKFFDYVTSNSYNAGNGDVYAEGTEIASFENISQKYSNDNFILSMSWRLW